MNDVEDIFLDKSLLKDIKKAYASLKEGGFADEDIRNLIKVKFDLSNEDLAYYLSKLEKRKGLFEAEKKGLFDSKGKVISIGAKIKAPSGDSGEVVDYDGESDKVLYKSDKDGKIYAVTNSEISIEEGYILEGVFPDIELLGIKDGIINVYLAYNTMSGLQDHVYGYIPTVTNTKKTLSEEEIDKLTEETYEKMKNLLQKSKGAFLKFLNTQLICVEKDGQPYVSKRYDYEKFEKFDRSILFSLFYESVMKRNVSGNSLVGRKIMWGSSERKLFETSIFSVRFKGNKVSLIDTRGFNFSIKAEDYHKLLKEGRVSTIVLGNKLLEGSHVFIKLV